MTEQGHDYSEFKQDAPVGGNLMARIEGVAQEQVDAEVLVANLDTQLAEAKSNLLDLMERRLPKLLDDAGLIDSKVVTPSGLTVEVDEKVRGSIPKANEPKAFEWLENDNNGRLIKRQITIEFGKGDEKWAEKFMRDCAQRKKPLNLKVKRSVNPQTLQAFVRQKLADGDAMPLETFGVYRQKFAKVKQKEKKGA